MKHLILKVFLAFVIVIICSPAVFAQKEKLSTKNKKAISAYYSGIQYFDYRKYFDAEEQFLYAISLDPAFIEARQMLGTMYEDAGNHAKAIEQYSKVQEINPVFFPNNYFLLGNLYLKEGRYDEALLNYNEFIALNTVSKSLRTQAEEQQQKAQFAVTLKNNPVSFRPENLGQQINTSDGEYSPTLTADEEILYFTKLRPRDQYTVHSSKFEEDFYVSRKENGQWTPAVPLGHPVNSYGNEGAACISPDGMFFIFTGCNRGDGLGSCDLYISRKEGGKWSAPENMGTPLNSAQWDTQPSIAPDGKTLYFASNRNGNTDIYMSIADENGNWQLPVNLGKPVNTSMVENSPFIHPDGKTLYFMSNGHPGMGGMDIFMSRKQTDGTWSEPVNIGYPINTHKDEGFFIVSASGNTAYYATDQLGGYGHYDIYSFDIPDEIKPEPVFYLKGTISDKTSGAPIRAEFELYDIESGTLIVNSFSDEKDGSFLVCIPSKGNYALSAKKTGYLFYSENFEFMLTSSEPLQKNISLQPISVGEIVIMRNIFFDFDKDQLKSESVIELQQLISLLNENPTMKIEIRGHTDNVGTSQYNKVLSEKRAKSVYEYLIQHGISGSRLSYKGFGDTQPMADNQTDKGRALNRRTEFMVVK
jgi:outer membrane protein OmpA-like peptidoglycan-associated protein